MSRAATSAVFLLPAWSAFAARSLPAPLAKALGRADRVSAEVGREAQLRRHFACLPTHAAPAALTRQFDAGDAAGAAWLRMDPAHVRPDLNGARLLGVGERLGLTQADVDALLPALKPLFGDSGFALDAPTPVRWYLRLPRETRLPTFSSPDDALGEDPFDHQPDGPEARRWRALLSEAQIVLHNHPWNAQRAERGLVSVNALWAWGGGLPPDRVVCEYARVLSEDDHVRALAAAGGAETAAPPPTFVVGADAKAGGAATAVLHDLRRRRDLDALQRDWLMPALDALQSGRLRLLSFDAADGLGFRLTAGQRWRLWRRSWAPPVADEAP